MQFFAILALALTATAAPSVLDARNKDHEKEPMHEEPHTVAPSAEVCSSNSKQVCCNNDALLGIPILSGCLLQVLGSACSSDAFCCDTENENFGTLIDISALQCVNL